MSIELLGFLQIWGGIFYLLNKIFFSLKERDINGQARRWRSLAWIVYIIGSPAWLIILALENNWMATLVETGGIPSMVLGLVLAAKQGTDEPSEKTKKWTRRLDAFAYISALIGIGVSLYLLGWMEKWSQWLELGLTAGFLVGTYKLAHDKLDGYLWFLPMNASAGWLVYSQGYFWLGLQQALSLVCVMDAYWYKRNRA